jgi:hypothetical protein
MFVKADIGICKRCQNMIAVGEGRMYRFSDKKYVDGYSCCYNGKVVLLERRTCDEKLDHPNEVPKDCHFILEHIISQEDIDKRSGNQ